MTYLAERKRRVRRRTRIAGAVTAFLVAAALVLVGSRGLYHEWPWSTYPTTLKWCDRDFVPTGGKVTRAQLYPGYHQFGEVQGWLNSGEVWALTGCGGDVPTGAAVRGDGDQFQQYTLLGGP